MTTPRQRAFVSIAATIIMTLALGACASAASRAVMDGPIAADTHPLTIRFDNLAREAVDVYLVGVKREWLLGRVAPGAIGSLRIPDGALAQDSMMVRLAVLAGERPTFQAARHPRARVTMALPAAAILAQRWTFSQGALMSLVH
jgi:hypothetical protein